MDWQRLYQVVIEELKRVGESHSCIMAGAVLIDVLNAKGIKNAYPLTVKPKILDPKFTSRLKREPFPQTPELLNEWADDGCNIVRIGHGEGSSRQWPAHLIVIIPKALAGRNAALDLTITQANVPAWGIELIPLMMAVPDEFLTGAKWFRAPVNDSLVIYEAFPEDRSFEETPLWSKKKRRNSIVKRILSRL